MRLVTFVSALALTCSSLSPADATGFACPVRPADYLGVASSGWVATFVQGVGVQQICSVAEPVGGVTPQACTAWYSSLLTWRTLNKSGAVYYDSTNATVAGKTSCTDFAPWESHTPYFLDLS